MGVNAQTTVPTFTAAQVLTADQMNQSARTGVPVFSNTTTRDAGFGGTGEKVLAEGQLCYLEDANVVQYYDGAAWATVGPSTGAVAQVKSTTKDDTFTSSSTTFVDVTGLSVSVTPTSASNKVLVIAQVSCANDFGVAFAQLQLLRDSTAIDIGAAAGSRTRASALVRSGDATDMVTKTFAFLDSPATTSATTYKIQGRSTSAGTFFINRSSGDTDNATHARGASTITVFEVAP